MKFNVYDIFVLEITQENGRWTAFRVGEGTRIPDYDLIVPQDLDESELTTFLDDMFHELARPGKDIKRLD